MYFAEKKSVLMLAQVCAIMPLSGITAKSPRQLKFTWINLRMLHTVFVMSVQLMNAYYAIRYALNNKVNISIMGMYTTKFPYKFRFYCYQIPHFSLLCTHFDAFDIAGGVSYELRIRIV